MSSGIDLRVSRGLELVQKLERIIADFAAREEQFVRDLRNRRQTANRKFREAIERLDTRLAAQSKEIESFAVSESERARAKFERRRAWIQTAQAITLRTIPKRTRAAKEKWMGDLQMRQFRAERKQTSDTDAAAAAFAKSSAQLAAHRATLAALQDRARRLFGGYRALHDLLASTAPQPREAATADDLEALIEELEARLAAAQEQLARFHQFLLPRVFGYLPLPLLLPLIIGAGVASAFFVGASALAIGIDSGVVLALVVIVCVLYGNGLAKSRHTAAEIAATFAELSQAYTAACAAAELRHSAERERIAGEAEQFREWIEGQWARTEHVESDFAAAARKKIEQQVRRLNERNAMPLPGKLSRIESDRASRLAHLTGDVESRKQQLTSQHDADTASFNAEEAAGWESLQHEWQAATVPIFEEIAAMNAASDSAFPAWSEALVESWSPPGEFTALTRFAHLTLNLSGRAVPQDRRLALPVTEGVRVPLALTFPDQGSLLFETRESGGVAVLDPLNNVILRLLSKTPPGKIAFTFIDPVGLGQNFAGLMHLGDYEESVINRRIWTQRDQIEDRLAELSEHIEKVIQMYLRNEYATITEYNEQAGSVAEKYHFLVIADFPANISEVAAKRLQSIAISGPRCGVFTLIHWDQRLPLPDGFSPDELRANSVCVHREGDVFFLTKEQRDSGSQLLLDAPPAPELAASLVHRIGKASVDSNRVEVPFSQIAPPPHEMWTGDTTSELRIAIGRTGATKHQMLAIGKGTRQHALFAGKTGSGKSTLFHVIITNLALTCSPDQVEFYLIDFKKGVEFKCYAEKRLPHARVIAIESDREFALSVLQRVDDELKRRGDIFRKLGVQDIPGYKRAGGTEPMPRSLLLIDEFQEFFVEDDEIAQTASMLFDRIVRQGRAFGIHVLLGSQTLGGAYTLARATLGQMVIRVALQCNEADAYLIMDDSNSAPRLLSRPGEGIYNDAAGAVEGNSPFQVVWLADNERDVWLEKVRTLAIERHDQHPSPIVFEGNSPADIRDNDLLRGALAKSPAEIPPAAHAWLGAPNSIKGPTEALFRAQSGNNLLIVGQRDEAIVTMIGLSLIALAAQHPAGGARLILVHASVPGSRDAEFFDRIAAAIPQLEVVANANVPEVIGELASGLKERGASSAPVFVFIHGLQKFKKLRPEDDFSFGSGSDDSNTGAQFTELITEGPAHGIHIIAAVDTFNNVSRFISRKALSEFEMRVVFQMSANDSASLIDSPKASGLGLHRALFFNEHQGYIETFRPYTEPERAWIEEAAAQLAKRAGAAASV